MDINYLSSWIGRTETVVDLATAAPLKALSATLDRDDAPPSPGDIMAPCWHWLYFLPAHRQSDIDGDGHPKRGGFLPPVPLPRRMWAGGRLQFLAPIRVGQSIVRTSRIEDVRLKEGRSGPLVFVKVLHQVTADDRLAVLEEQDIVYRDMPQPSEPALAGVPVPWDPSWSRSIVPSEVFLFRYSALTFNGHRIHYDRPYATEIEVYPGLVVHGPLIATLLLDLLRRELPEAQITRFAFKAVKPIFDLAPFNVCGHLVNDKEAKLWACTPEGHLAMEASVSLA